jgi:hypothetical protein
MIGTRATPAAPSRQMRALVSTGAAHRFDASALRLVRLGDVSFSASTHDTSRIILVSGQWLAGAAHCQPEMSRSAAAVTGECIVGRDGCSR